MSVIVPSVHNHILFHRHGYGLNLSHQFPNYREDPNACNSYGTTPLHVLSLTNCGAEIAEELIKSGARVNAMNHFGSTPLHFAVIHRNEWMIDILIEHGADVNLRDMNGNSALHFAVRNSKTLLYLPEYQTGDLCIVQKLISFGADIDVVNINCETPLMWAIREGNLDIVKELLAFGANVNARKIGLETCLHVVSKTTKLNKDIVVELVKHGACVNSLDQDGKTVFDMFLLCRNQDLGFECAKEVIKIATLVNFEHKTNFGVSKDFILNEFINKCFEEVTRMKAILYTDEFSLCQFALNGCCDIKCGNLCDERVFDQVLEILSKSTFPVYNDFIQANFKRPYLSRKSLKLNIFARNEGDNKKTSLNPDVIFNISSFLSDRDLFNFVRAYVKSVEPLTHV